MATRHARSTSEYVVSNTTPVKQSQQQVNPSTPVRQSKNSPPSQLNQLEETLMNDLMKSIEKKQSKTTTFSGQQTTPSKESMQQTIQNRLTGMVEHNQEYFDHLAGKCICARCNCGKHKCGQRSGLVTDGKRIPKTNYQSFYDEKQAKGMQTRGECPLDNITVKKDVKFEGNTTHRDHFTPKAAGPVERSGKKEDNIRSPGIPNDYSTAYRDGYVQRNIVRAMPILPNSHIGVVRGSPFIGKTENQISYSPEKYRYASPAEKADISKHSRGVNMGYDQSKVPGFYESTYRQHHSPVRGSLDDNKKILDSMKRASQPTYKSTELNFFPISTQKDHFRPTQAVCPIVMERTRGMSTYAGSLQSTGGIDRLNMSVNI